MHYYLDREKAEAILIDVAQRADEWFGLINGMGQFIDKLDRCIVVKKE